MQSQAFNVGLNYGLLKFAADLPTQLEAGFASRGMTPPRRPLPEWFRPPTQLTHLPERFRTFNRVADTGAQVGSGALRRAGRNPLALGAIALGGIGAGFGLGRATAPQPPPRRSAFGW